MNHATIRTLALVVTIAIVPACGGKSRPTVSNPGAPAPVVPNFVIPGAGGLTISAKGGTASGVNAGNGGTVTIQGQSGSAVNVRKGAYAVDTSFTVPPALSFDPATLTAAPPAGFDFGSNVLVATTTTLVPPAGGGLIPNGPGGGATGLYIPPGVTLTVAPDGGAGPSGTLFFTDGVLIAGHLVMQAPVATNDALNLSITCRNFVMTPGSTLTTTGLAGSGGLPNGGKGGALFLVSFTPAIVLGDVVLQGTIDLSGGSTAIAAGSGGTGGDGFFCPSGALYCTGTVRSDGGNATGASSAAGGFGGRLYVIGDPWGSIGDIVGKGILSSGTWGVNGGAGGGGAGGDGGLAGRIVLGEDPSFYTAQKCLGPLVIGGVLQASAGNAGSAGGVGAGPGYSPSIVLQNSGSPILVSATITAMGGNGMASGLTADSGSGGTVLIASVNRRTAIDATALAVGSGGIAVSGAITLDGGNGNLGGLGGTLTITENQNGAPAGLNPINVVGYDLIDLTCGTGPGAGVGGTVQIANLVHTDQTSLTHAGGILNSVALTLNGADGTNYGGSGGTVFMGAPMSECDGPRQVINQGAITMNGGAGSIFAGSGGSVQIQDFFSASNAGAIQASAGSGGTLSASAGGSLQIQSNGSAQNSGTFTANGGNGTTGGAGGSFTVTTAAAAILADSSLTSVARNAATGTVIANGGNGAAGPGGPGGTILITGNNEVGNDASITVLGGSGTPGGSGGSVTILNSITNYSPGASVENAGALVTTGGVGSTAGGGGGAVLIEGRASVANSGSVMTSGGTGAGAGAGGSGGMIRVTADGSVSSIAAYTQNGAAGLGTGTGGSGGSLYLVGQTVSHSGNISAAGANGGGGAAGGNGGVILVSSVGGTSVVHGQVSVPAGAAGSGTPVVGTIEIDGIEQSLVNGVGTF